jgi:hypothetical protein
LAQISGLHQINKELTSYSESKRHSSFNHLTLKFIKGVRYAHVILLLFSLSAVSGQYYGMQFSGHEVPLNERSGLDLTPNRSINIKGELDLEFNLRFDPDHHSYFGYVFRMVIGGRNIDLIYGIVPGNPNNFELILGDKTSKIAFPMELGRLFSEWLHLEFKLDFKNRRITCLVDGKEITDELVGFDPSDGFRLMFGAHSFGNFSSTDVPPMIIRDVVVRVKKKKACHWSLNETEGTTVHSVPAGYNGKAVNPIWLLKQHNTWKKVLDLNISDTVKSCFDGRNEALYLLSPDTIYIYCIKSDTLLTIPQSSPTFLGRSNHIFRHDHREVNVILDRQ